MIGQSITGKIKGFLSPLKFKSFESKNLVPKELDYAAGLDYKLENPDTLLWDKGDNLELYTKMLKDDRIESIEGLKKRLILSTPANIVPASDDEKDQEISTFIEWDFFQAFQIKFFDILDNYLDAKSYGYKVGELVWDNAKTAEQKGIRIPNEYQDKIFVSKIKHRNSILYDFDYDEWGNLDALYIGRNYGGDEVIKGKEIFNKFLIFVYPYIKDGNWYGESELTSVYTQYYAKWYIFRYRNRYLEKWGSPTPEVIYDKMQMSETEVSALNELMQNFQDNMFLINPGQWSAKKEELVGKFKFILHEVQNGKATDQFENAIDQIDTQIARKLLVPDKMGFTKSDGGSYAMAETQISLLTSVIENDQLKLENLIDGLIRQIVDINYSNVEIYPTFKFDKSRNKLEAEAAKVLIEAGIIDPEEQWLRQHLGIPTLTEQEKEEIEKEKEERIKKAQENMIPENDNDEQDKSDDDKPKDNPKKEDKIENKQDVIENEFCNLTHEEIDSILFSEDAENIKSIDEYNKNLEKQEFKKDKFYSDPAKIENKLDDMESDFVEDYSIIYFDNIKALTSQVKNKDIASGNNKNKIATLRIDKTPLKKLFSRYYAKLYFNGKIDGIDETKGRLKKLNNKIKFEKINFELEDNWLDRRWIDNLLSKQGDLGELTEEDIIALKEMRNRAFDVAGDTESRMTKIVGNTVHEGLRSNRVAKDIITDIEKELTEDLQKHAGTIARTNASDYYNSGRMNFFTSDEVSPFVEAYVYRAIIDDRTTLFCESHNGQIIKKGSGVAVINPPNHFNCRSYLETIMIGESQSKDSPFEGYKENEKKFPKWGTNKNASGESFNMGDPSVNSPADGFGGTK